MIADLLGLLREMLASDDISEHHRSVTFVRPPPDTPEVRVAVHETGHLLAAWACSAVTVVQVATTKDTLNTSGGVLFRMLPTEKPADHWCMMVIQLAGLAAEGLVFRKTSGGAFRDLTHARRHSLELEECGYHPPLLSGPTIDFCKAFVPEPSGRELSILQNGYRKARQLIEEHGQLFHTCVRRLLTDRELVTHQIAEILGPRQHLALLLAAGSRTFIVSRGPT